MIGKFIECEVAPEKIERFSKAQESWNEITSCQGFNGQLGGWDSGRSSALVFAKWENLNSLESFMSSKHDDIFESSQQQKTYRKLSISLLRKELEIPSHNGLSVRIRADIRFVRIADCILFAGEECRFRATQKTIWNPGMSACSGMLGGFLWRSIKNPLRFLVTSFWESEERHQYYTTNILPELRSKSNIESSIESMNGYQFKTEPNWMICPDTSNEASVTPAEAHDH